jgi:hypothetical protein
LRHLNILTACPVISGEPQHRQAAEQDGAPNQPERGDIFFLILNNCIIYV